MEIEEEKVLERDGKINWEYLYELKKKENKNDFHQAMFLLKNKGRITMYPFGGFFVYSGGFHIGPRISDVGYLGYFIREEDAKEFQKRFHPDGLIAKIEE
ncbi:MAG: hypothetical protein AABW93_04310 [Nanoarchaeota archaeon]|mgnify:FL=1